jgi:hypothetical protein
MVGKISGDKHLAVRAERERERRLYCANSGIEAER